MWHTGLKVLVIDDFSMMARLMKRLAEEAGFTQVDVCHDGDTALEMLKSRDYDFVLCDIEMQPMSGVEFVRQARTEPAGGRCVIVLTTASRESAARAVQEGIHLLADGFILKPFTAADLRTKLSEIAQRRLRKPAAAG